MQTKQSERDVRIQKLQKIRDFGINPYPARFPKEDKVAEIISQNTEKKHRKIEEIIENPQIQVSTAGRIMLHRSHGKILFMKIQDQDEQIQIMFHRDNCKIIDEEGGVMNNLTNNDGDDISAYKFAEKMIDMGDFVGVKGELFHTHKGELTIFVSDFQLLTKALRPLPDKHSGLADMETRLRKRYMDTVVNKDVKETLMRRTQFRQEIRNFFISKDFVEVHTPVLETTTGGADANPFATHHKAFDLPLYLRISAGELWQKRLMVGGFEKTFEVARIFRNEGASPDHAQDYMSVENYWAYSNFEDQMGLIKEMYLHIVDKVYGKRIFTIRGHKVNFDDERKKYDFTKIIKDMTDIDIRDATNKEILAKLDELKIDAPDKNRARIIDYLRKHCRKQISGPGFLINEPKFMSPLAKSIPGKENLTQRFHILIAGSEIGNGYSELNDPIDQAERFQEQQDLRDAGDDEAQMADREFVEALEHGMPPVTGFGTSERLFAFLEDKPVREVAFFPLMKPVDHIIAKDSDAISPKIEDQSLKSHFDNKAPISDDIEMYEEIPSIEEAHNLAEKYLTDTKQHCYQVAKVMKHFAQKLGQNEELRYLIGLLHDIDRDHIKKDAEKHLKAEFEEIMGEINASDILIEDIRSHYEEGTGVPINTLMRKYLASVDELTAFVHTVSLMRPNGIDDMKAKSVSKKIKDKGFAAAVSREHLKNCEKYLSIPMAEFIPEVIEALKE